MSVGLIYIYAHSESAALFSIRNGSQLHFEFWNNNPNKNFF